MCKRSCLRISWSWHHICQTATRLSTRSRLGNCLPSGLTTHRDTSWHIVTCRDWPLSTSQSPSTVRRPHRVCMRFAPRCSWSAMSSIWSPDCQWACRQRPGMDCSIFNKISLGLFHDYSKTLKPAPSETSSPVGFHGTSIWAPLLSDLLSWSSRCKGPRKPHCKYSAVRTCLVDASKVVLSCLFDFICFYLTKCCSMFGWSNLQVATWPRTRQMSRKLKR